MPTAEENNEEASEKGEIMWKLSAGGPPGRRVIVMAFTLTTSQHGEHIRAR